MKNMTKIALLLAVLATGNSAQAQTVLYPGRAYTFTATAASGTGTISYQWYRNGEPISGATSQNYTLPDDLAWGKNVEFKRRAMSTICPYNAAYTDSYIIAFCGALVDGTCWATTNVDAFGVFAAIPDMNTRFYQWNRAKAWAATGSISGWNSTADTSSTWTVNPCPIGWRLPTQAEFKALHDAGTYVADAGARGATVAGRFYGPNASTSSSCKLPNTMTNCIFLPANGVRHYSDGSLLVQGQNGYYSSGTEASQANGYLLYFGNASNPSSSNSKAYGHSIRCVQ